jgi:large subunit ribosomal protein L18
MHAKTKSRLKRALKTRMKIRELGVSRLCVHRTPSHIYAQITTSNGDKVIVSASTLDSRVKSQIIGSSGNIAAAETVGRTLAELAVQAGITKVAFDRSGYKYHGRVKALADAARNAGLLF